MSMEGIGVRYGWHEEVRTVKPSFNDEQVFAIERPSK